MQMKFILIILILISAAYLNSLFNGFVGDDNVLFVNNSFYRSWDNFPRLFKEGYNYDSNQQHFKEISDYGSGSVSYRPIDNITYFIDYSIWKLNPFGYHLTNLLIHLFNVFLIYFLLFRFGVSAALALFASLLFGLHPVQSEAVCAIGYRADLLACFFVLASIHCWLSFIRETRKGRVLGVMAILLYALAVFSKESAIVLPAIIILLRVLEKKPRRVRGLYVYYVGFCCVAAFYLYVYFFVFPNSAIDKSPFSNRTALDFINNLVIIFMHYMGAFLVPTNVNPVPPLYLPSKSFNLIKLILLGAGMVMMLLLFSRNCLNKILLFFLVWFLIFYIPVSNVVPIPNPIAWRFMYLPSVGFIVFLALFLDWLCSTSFVKNISNNISLIIKTVIIIYFLVLTIILNMLWRNDYLIATIWAKNYPDSWKAHMVLGQLNYMKHDFFKAQEFFFKSIEFDGRKHECLIDNYLGFCFLKTGQIDRAKTHFDIILKCYPDYADANYGLGLVLQLNNDFEHAIKFFNKAIQIKPDVIRYYSSAIEASLILNDLDSAVHILKAAEKKLLYEQYMALKKFYDEKLNEVSYKNNNL